MTNTSKYDCVGIICSGACAIHCSVFPLLLSFFPSFSSYLENEWLHIALLMVLFPTSLIAFYRNRRKNRAFILGIIGIVFLISAVIGENILGSYAESGELVLTLVGSLFLIYGHLLNLNILKH